MRRWMLTLSVLWVGLAGAGCGVTNPDKHFCSDEHPGCPNGLECNGKECVEQGTVAPDTGAPDVAMADSTVDVGAPDVATPDSTVDAGVPDVAVPDVAQPDLAPDLAPDGTAPDVLSSDTSVDVGACSGGETESCYSGAITTLNVGTCKAGTRTCGADGSWGPCAGEVTPVSVELCDTLDDDCDGTVDNACIACIDGETRPCGIDTGACSKGVQTCSSGQWGSCNGSVGPTAEQCDSTDHDCDGNAYNGFECKPGDSDGCKYVGSACSVESTMSCNSSTCTWNACAKPAEQCDGVDHNCDGNPYDGLCVPGSCSESCGPFPPMCTTSAPFAKKICSADCKYPKTCGCYTTKCVK